MLMIDARTDAPAYAITLTTRDPYFPADLFRDANAHVWKALRREFGRVEYHCQVEFTTGKAARSGGHRRIHAHGLVKGDLDVLVAERIVERAWRATTKNGGYESWIVEVAELRTPGAAIHYLGVHHRKPEQRPPADWVGRLERTSQNYFVGGKVALRTRALNELRAEALAYRTGLSLDDATFLVLRNEDAKAELRVERRMVALALREERISPRQSSASHTLENVTGLDPGDVPFVQGRFATVGEI